MDIRELRYFVQVARAGSFSAATARLNVAQPALSRQLKKLEDELGVQLLVRHGRGVEVTEAGAILLSEAEALIGHMNHTLDRVRGGPRTFSGQVTLGVAPTSGLLIVPDIFARFRELWPDATLMIREGLSSSLEEWLYDRRIDIAVLHNPLPFDGIELRPLLHERMVLAMAAGHPAAAASGIAFAEVADVPLILPALPHSNRRLLERAAAQHNFRLNVVLEVDSIPLIKSMVGRGFGATIQTYAGVALEAGRGEFVARPIERPALTSTICLAMPGEARTAWLTQEVSRLLRACVAGLVARGSWAGARMVEEEG